LTYEVSDRHDSVSSGSYQGLLSGEKEEDYIWLLFVESLPSLLILSFYLEIY
jgi:hypothetical protein